MRKGFTLIELIVVIIIVGILASVGLTQYTKVVEKGRTAEAKSVLGSLRTLEMGYKLENTAYSSVTDLDSTIPTACATTHYFYYSCNTTTGTCTATRCMGGGKTPNSTIAYYKDLTIAGVMGGTPGY